MISGNSADRTLDNGERSDSLLILLDGVTARGQGGSSFDKGSYCVEHSLLQESEQVSEPTDMAESAFE